MAIEATLWHTSRAFVDVTCSGYYLDLCWLVIGCVRLASLGRPRFGVFYFFPGRTWAHNYPTLSREPSRGDDVGAPREGSRDDGAGFFSRFEEVRTDCI